jgi:predicted RecB family nuclease
VTTDEMPGALDGAVEWVTKTNVTDHARCPRAWWLIAHGEITHEESISPYDLPEVEAGVEFERDIVAGARPVDLDELTAGVEMSAAGQPPLVLETGLWINHDLGLRGEPDGIEIASGAWAPVEVKHHSRATPLDRLELAFYWMLLEPQREDSSPSPHGYLILDGVDGPAEPARIDLQPSHFAKVRQHIDAVRQARTGSEPLGCGRCHVCRRLRPQGVMSYDDWWNDLGTLFGLGYNRALQLAMVGIQTSTDLLDAGVEDILDRIKGRRWSFGRYQVEGWAAHAQAWADNEPVIYGNPPLMPGDYTTFDLEYLRQGEIWLAGMRPSDGDLTQIWAWTADEEPDLMRAVADYWAVQPDALMATWWGKGADMPAIKRATERTGVAFDLSTINHFDLCYWAMAHLRLPIRGLSLKDVAS